MRHLIEDKVCVIHEDDGSRGRYFARSFCTMYVVEKASHIQARQWLEQARKHVRPSEVTCEACWDRASRIANHQIVSMIREVYT